jgi:hypothetical protein
MGPWVFVEQETRWSVTIMQERLFPQAPARAVQPQRPDIPPRHRSAALGPFTCHSLLESMFREARRLPCLFEHYFYVHIITCSKDSASRRLASPVHQEPGGGRGPMIWRRPPNPIPLPELEPRF